MSSLGYTLVQPVAAAPQVFTPLNLGRIRNYELCLHFVQHIISGYFPAAGAREHEHLFHTLGQVACCIDTHLDDLNLEQKKLLLEKFPVYFDTLPADESVFHLRLKEICSQLHTFIYPPSAAIMLYRFHRYCAERNLLDELKAFSLQVIRSSVQKAEARGGKEVLHCLALEGEAAIRFLLLLLQKEGVIPASGIKKGKLNCYLQRLERMLNIADDLADCRHDREKGVIRVNTGLAYHFTLVTRLLQTFALTIFRHHVFFFMHFFRFTHRWLALRRRMAL